jgi:predicted GNAT family acetyltransferase
VRFVLTSDPEEFSKKAWPFIEPQLECNVMASVAQHVLDGHFDGIEPVFALGFTAGGEVGFAAIRTPPWFMLVSELDPAQAPDLMAKWLEADPEPPGVSGLPATARAIADAWQSQTHGTTRCRMSEAMHSLTEVQDPARPAPGELRLPAQGDHELLVAWMEQFAREANLPGADRARRLLRTRYRGDRLMLWDDGGPRSMVGMAGPIAGVARIGPVYTPPEHRQRGYASAAVAAFSRRALARGAHTCMLYTDLANPTSNKIYAEVGYRRFGDWEEHAFGI